MSHPDQPDTALTSSERRSIAILASLYALRMLGLFMVLPVMSVFAAGFKDSTPQKVGIALGIYGLTQAVLQIPFGMLSDRIGRKAVIYGGLAIFAAGSVVAALANTMSGLIIGRALQGAGAIPSTVMALVADLTRDEQRSKAMAIIGMSIGLSFMLAMLLGPVLSGHFGFSGLFWTVAALALCGMLVLSLVPSPVASRHQEVSPVMSLVRRSLADPQLVRLYTGIFILHATLTAIFVVLPAKLVAVTGLAVTDHGRIYLPVLVISFVLMLPLLVGAERAGKVRLGFCVAILAMMAGVGLLAGTRDLVMGVWIPMLAFFAGFNLLEALLPSLVSRQVFAGGRGTAMGIYSTSQFLGIFAGGGIGGWCLAHWGPTGVEALCLFMLLGWLVIAISMAPPPRVRTLVLNYDQRRFSAQDLVQAVSSLPGVADVMVADGSSTAYVKVDHNLFRRESLAAFEVVETR